MIREVRDLGPYTLSDLLMILERLISLPSGIP